MTPDLSTWTPTIEPERDPAKLAELQAKAASYRKVLEYIRTKAGGSHPYVDWVPHEKQASVWYDQAAMIVITAANRAGKSACGVALDVFCSIGIPPMWFLAPCRVPYLGSLPWPTGEQPWQVWIVTPDADVRERTIVKSYIEKWLPPEFVKARKRDRAGRTRLITTPIAEITFISQDQKLKKVMGAQVDRIHEDEELFGEEGDLWRGELLARLGDRQGRYMMTMTPVETARRGGDSWLVNEIIGPVLEGKRDPRDYSVHQWSIDDNTHWSVEQREAQKRKYLDRDGNPTWEYSMRCLGEIVGMSVAPVFEPSHLAHQRKTYARPHLLRGGLHDHIDWIWPAGRYTAAAVPVPGVELRPEMINFQDSPAGDLYLWRAPQRGMSYTIGVDVSQGKPGGNPSCAAVFNRNLGTFDAYLWGLVEPMKLVVDLIRLATWYNLAWLCIEERDQGPTMLFYLVGNDGGSGQRYPYLYTHQVAARTGAVQRDRPGYPAGPDDKLFMLSLLSGSMTPRVKGDWATVPVRYEWDRVLAEMQSVRKDVKSDAGDKIIYPRRRAGTMLTHCDTMVGSGLALVAHQSPLCPMHIEPVTAAPRGDVMSAMFEEQMRREMARGSADVQWERMPDVEPFELER